MGRRIRRSRGLAPEEVDRLSRGVMAGTSLAGLSGAHRELTGLHDESLGLTSIGRVGGVEVRDLLRRSSGELGRRVSAR